MAKMKAKNSSRLRLEGVLLYSHQPLKRALRNLRGIEEDKACVLVLRSRLDARRPVGRLTNQEIKDLRTTFSDFKFSTENVLLRGLSLAKQRLFETRLVRGLRLRKGLTNRGQRTRNNCQTLKRRS